MSLDALKIFGKIIVQPFSILGVQAQIVSNENPYQQEITETEVVEEPKTNTVLVDPAGFDFILTNRLKGATGASGALYKWMDQNNIHGVFADDVKQRFGLIQQNGIWNIDTNRTLNPEGISKYHTYPFTKGRHRDSITIIHTVGPDFRAEPHVSINYSDDYAIAKLTLAYKNTFIEFVDYLKFTYQSIDEIKNTTLRLLPISGGEFAGKYSNKIPEISMNAIFEGLLELDQEYLEILIHKKITIEMCVYVIDFQAEYMREQQEVYVSESHKLNSLTIFKEITKVSPYDITGKQIINVDGELIILEEEENKLKDYTTIVDFYHITDDTINLLNQEFYTDNINDENIPYDELLKIPNDGCTYKQYTLKNGVQIIIIHVNCSFFFESRHTHMEKLQKMTIIYNNIFVSFVSMIEQNFNSNAISPFVLRLEPIKYGIGTYSNDNISQITIEKIYKGFIMNQTAEDNPFWLKHINIEMCIFKYDDFEIFLHKLHNFTGSTTNNTEFLHNELKLNRNPFVKPLNSPFNLLSSENENSENENFENENSHNERSQWYNIYHKNYIPHRTNNIYKFVQPAVNTVKHMTTFVQPAVNRAQNFGKYLYWNTNNPENTRSRIMKSAKSTYNEYTPTGFPKFNRTIGNFGKFFGGKKIKKRKFTRKYRRRFTKKL